MLNMQNVKDIEITEGNVRTIHDKDNRLIWGRLAYDTKYAGDTYQQTYSGKNLFDSPNSAAQTYRANYSQIDANSFTITSTETTGGTAYIRIDKTLQPNETYTISWSKTVTAGTPTSIAGNLAVQVGTSGTIPSPIQSPVTVTTDSSGLLRLYFYLGYAGSGTTTIDDAIKVYDVQLEQGSTATTYEPYVGGIPAPNPDYPQAVQVVTGEQTVTISDGVDSEDFTISLGSIELCKIGTYQDYIYKSSDDWYVHKETGTQVLNGTEANWASGTSSGYLRCNVGVSGISDVGGLFATDSISDHFTASSTANYGVFFHNTVRLFFYPQSSITSLADFKSWLGSNNTTVYYPLATPTDTKITDATLVGQLNAVHEWLTRYGYNATVTGNLPIIINQTNL